jgi:hypothetical protein
MPLQETSGNLTTDAFGGGVAAVVPNYIEDVFSTWLYTGNNSTQNIVNGIDLSTKGGLVWIKSRSAATDHKLTDTARGATKALISDTDGAQTTDTTGLTAFGTTGFTIGADSNYNTSAATYTSWTFRKQPKFFDVVTFSGNGGTQNIAHNLGSVPGCVIVKFISGAAGVGNWPTWHRSLSSGNIINLNLNQAQNGPFPTYFGDNTITVNPTSTQFTVGSNVNVNGAGSNYVAYLFAHNAGGFGLTGTDNVISCGSFTVSGNVASVNLGYEPQWLLIKKSSGAGNWGMKDVMRGGLGATSSGTNVLYSNYNDAEASSGNWEEYITSTGFGVTGMVDADYIYIAIRRGPMKVPTDATKVFYPKVTTAQGQVTTGFTVDLGMWFYKTGYSENTVVNDRLRGVGTTNTVSGSNLVTSDTRAEAASQGTRNWDNTGFYAVSAGAVFYSFGRAPSFFDEVCYTGNGSYSQSVTHNLGVQPEFAIIKRRDSTSYWMVTPSISDANAGNGFFLQTNGALTGSGPLLGVSSTTFTAAYLGGNTNFSANISSATYVAYLFATCAGVSKVGSYTGNGTTQTINCGFTGGARFVLIKRTDATGDWYVYDTARGMTTLTDPYLLLNSTAAETATLGSVTTVSTGFALNASILAAINTSSATYIFLAIA